MNSGRKEPGARLSLSGKSGEREETGVGGLRGAAVPVQRSPRREGRGAGGHGRGRRPARLLPRAERRGARAARRTAAIVKVRMHSTGADFGGLSRRPSPLTSREPTSQLQFRWAGATELNPWQGAVMEGSEIFLAALFDWNLKDHNGGLRRNGGVGEDGLHSGRLREDLRRRQLDDDK